MLSTIVIHENLGENHGSGVEKQESSVSEMVSQPVDLDAGCSQSLVGEGSSSTLRYVFLHCAHGESATKLFVMTDLQSYLDSSKNGVVYMSLGSKIRFSDLPWETMQVFLNVFASLPYDVLIKWNGGELKNKPANVRLKKWLPQNDMLHHPKIKVFLMQGGLQSTDEAIAANVPLIGFPVFGNQFYNSQTFIKLDIGRQLDINTINEHDLRQVILDVAGNERYRCNIAALSRELSEQRAGGLKRAVRGAARVAARAARHLRSPLADASLAQYLMLDVLAAVAAVAALGAVAATALLIVLYKAVRKVLAAPQPKLKLKSK